MMFLERVDYNIYCVCNYSSNEFYKFDSGSVKKYQTLVTFKSDL